jgi:hypothetical protein
MYTDLASFPEALRVAKKHAPHLVNEINTKYMSSAQQGTGQEMSGDDLFHSAKVDSPIYHLITKYAHFFVFLCNILLL